MLNWKRAVSPNSSDRTAHKRPSHRDCAHSAVGYVDLRKFRYSPCAGQLTRTRLLIAQLVCCGLADKEIAQLLGVTTQTVKFHVSQSMRMIYVQRRTQLARYMFETNQFSIDAATSGLREYLSIKSLKPRNLAAVLSNQ